MEDREGSSGVRLGALEALPPLPPPPPPPGDPELTLEGGGLADTVPVYWMLGAGAPSLKKGRMYVAFLLVVMEREVRSKPPTNPPFSRPPTWAV